MIAGHSMRGFCMPAWWCSPPLSIWRLRRVPPLLPRSCNNILPSAASITVWLPVLLAGGIREWYTLTLLGRNRTFGLFRSGGTASYWPLVVMMGLLWLGSIVVYGNGVTKIGALGLVIGWPVFMSGAVIASAGWGSLFGEWKNSGKTAKVSMTAGVLCLMTAITILSRAGH